MVDSVVFLSIIIEWCLCWKTLKIIHPIQWMCHKDDESEYCIHEQIETKWISRTQFYVFDFMIQWAVLKGSHLKCVKEELAHLSNWKTKRQFDCATKNDASGKTKNNFSMELFQLFSHACKRLRRIERKKPDCTKDSVEWSEIKAMDSSASCHPCSHNQ